jgi:hypothetical protein
VTDPSTHLTGEQRLSATPFSWLGFFVVLTGGFWIDSLFTADDLHADVGFGAFLAVLALRSPRALVIDDEGFQKVCLFYRRQKVLWKDVAYLRVSYGGRLPNYLTYRKVGSRPRWLRNRSIYPIFARRPFGRCLTADDLCELLNKHHAAVCARRRRASVSPPSSGGLEVRAYRGPS